MTHFDSGNSFLALFFRLYWIFLWGFPIMYLFNKVMENKSVGLNVLWWLIPVSFSMIIARFIDIRIFKGYNMDGRPSGLRDFKIYSLYAVGINLFIFGIIFLLKTFGF